MGRANEPDEETCDDDEDWIIRYVRRLESVPGEHRQLHHDETVSIILRVNGGEKDLRESTAQ